MRARDNNNNSLYSSSNGSYIQLTDRTQQEAKKLFKEIETIKPDYEQRKLAVEVIYFKIYI